MSDHVVSWAASDEPRFELAEVLLHLGTLSARGTMLVGGDDPYRVDYRLDTGPRFITKRLMVQASGRTWERSLRLRRDADGEWSIRRTAEAGDDAPLAGADELADALDCDLRFSPLTNTMPMLRHRLTHDFGLGPRAVCTALVLLPSLAVVRSDQAYEHRRTTPYGAVVSHLAGGLAADVVVSTDGFVSDYPGVARRVGPPAPERTASGGLLH
ncbi:MAG: putative glycolipid-binding domain-containing protein [Mycobacteriales bacterium]